MWAEATAAVMSHRLLPALMAPSGARVLFRAEQESPLARPSREQTASSLCVSGTLSVSTVRPSARLDADQITDGCCLSWPTPFVGLLSVNVHRLPLGRMCSPHKPSLTTNLSHDYGGSHDTSFEQQGGGGRYRCQAKPIRLVSLCLQHRRTVSVFRRLLVAR